MWPSDVNIDCDRKAEVWVAHRAVDVNGRSSRRCSVCHPELANYPHDGSHSDDREGFQQVSSMKFSHDQPPFAVLGSSPLSTSARMSCLTEVRRHSKDITSSLFVVVAFSGQRMIAQVGTGSPKISL